ncbi:hypothetical protein E2562_007254 [Oryza meyeriana var. granulata]|uniref:Uncharacterized protein n=1 Tax=Oryza meyeriana var. granulata TaxID=110450 RepID=A0A6G1CE31_9ORYZ|nr:hypothetical protein E2562_007254 [Oryza meyeriana var. granulata]
MCSLLDWYGQTRFFFQVAELGNLMGFTSYYQWRIYGSKGSVLAILKGHGSLRPGKEESG